MDENGFCQETKLRSMIIYPTESDESGVCVCLCIWLLIEFQLRVKSTFQIKIKTLMRLTGEAKVCIIDRKKIVANHKMCDGVDGVDIRYQQKAVA